MIMKQLKYIAFMLLFGAVCACNKLDIAPVNIVQDKDLFTDAGMQAYMAALYSRMPIEDFKYSAGDGTEGFNTWNQIALPMLNTGENANRNNGGFVNPARGYWKSGYQVIRYSNYLIENLPAYAASLTQPKVDKWIAEARFIRAFTYFALVKRYGGVPITSQVQALNANVEELQIPRNSEQEVYDFILADLDYAITNMNEASEQKGRVNKNIAAAFKSRVALFAGSKARYGTQYVVDGVMLNGIPAAKANDYFKLSFQAAKMIEGKYSLYKKTWSPTDKIASANNYAALFLDTESPETIFSKGYSFVENVHSFDAVYSPPHMTSTYGDRFNPTLDYVELFDGLPKNSRGEIQTTKPDGTYIVYDYVEQLFENCEPRLRGTVLLPGQAFKGLRTDLRRGTFIESIDPATPIQKLVPEGSTAAYSSNPFYNPNVKQAGTWNSQVPIVLSTGQSINPNGLDGPTSSNNATVTGFHGRKYLNPNVSAALTKLHESTQSWIEIRYAEVLLNRAEAALELAQHGVNNLDGVDLQNDAFVQINAIRERAGAVLLTDQGELSAGAALAPGTGTGSYVLAPTRGLQLVRIERRKELAFEHKLWWDMLRWRTADLEVNSRIWRKLNPFLFAKGSVPEAPDYVKGKYIFDARLEERNSRFTVATKYYYEAIPGAEIAANPKLKQNEQY